MSRGDVNEPTREYPEYAKGRAGPVDPGNRDEGSDDADGRFGEIGQPPGTTRYADVPGAQLTNGGSGGWRRGLFWLAGLIGLVVILGLTTQAAGFWPAWRNPFAAQQTDRTEPPLLQSIQDLSRFVAAEGNFQVIVDLEQDRQYVPDFLLNERTLFVGVGSVEAYVDFAEITDESIIISEDRQSVQISLPAPRLTEADLDLEASYVFAEQRGLLNRLGEVFGGDPNRQRQVYQLAEERITAAARDSELAQRAEENTRKMLAGLLRSLGYETVLVTFVTP
ncbi:DUF4230 domain-containing protein [Solwaraspora sp. WMMD406]|uniref:DUF4230 domain-containing protein n=1 Tax=Solwaraspora sp. WMMD406 TaxID=3016095 RepID=UPI0024177F2F|nr:DUF4230 domain-containing protein [Solwaraspora sp. WMMD406]MDG4763484.1 DUF4230 domain-containing protein [Solwaraspora sp. WMMD406]